MDNEYQDTNEELDETKYFNDNEWSPSYYNDGY